jgi:hypothetical protein
MAKNPVFPKTAYATEVTRGEDGKWVGLNGPLHPNDQEDMDRVLRVQYDDALSQLGDVPLPKAESFGDLLGIAGLMKDHVRLMRDLASQRVSLGDDAT